jgi:hypothetical protein
MTCFLRQAALALLAIATISMPTANAYTTTRKFNPGHYTVLLHSQGEQRYMDDARRPGMRGITKKYYWRELEPSRGIYDLAEIRADLDWAQAYGMQLIIMIEDKTFQLERPNPAYLDSLTPRNRAGGYTMVRWSPTVVERYKALVAAIGRRFDAHPNFEGIAAQETALGLDSATLQKFGYTAEKYRDSSIAMYGYALSAMPRSRLFWYQNYLVGDQAYIGSIAAALGPKGLVMAGPDVLPDSKSLTEKSYVYFHQMRDKMHLGIQVEGLVYRAQHLTNDTSMKYWSMGELFQFARDQLHVNYMFWVRVPKPTPADSNDWYDALPVIEANPVFGQ